MRWTGNLRAQHLAQLVLATILAASTNTQTALAAIDPAVRCERRAAIALVSCVKKLARQHARCYRTVGTANCAATDRQVRRVFDQLTNAVGPACDTVDVQNAGYGPSLNASNLISNLKTQCRAEALSLAVRSFGGPQGASLAAADEQQRGCLERVHKQGNRLLALRARAMNVCVDKERKGRGCDLARTNARIAKIEARVTSKITEACGTPDPLKSLIGLDLADFLDRTRAQSECLTAFGHPNVSPLDLDCGPRDDIGATPRGQFVQVVLDETEWGTRCGDGSPFAFWVRMAPNGSNPGDIVLQMQGGGVCLAEGDCASRNPGLFEALNDNPSQSGIMSNDPLVSPFANWTKVYLPYCNQDIFMGGGTTNTWPSVTVHRYGAVNVRAALRYVRDAVWRELNATTVEGYGPHRIRMLFGGTSAGGFGTLYNYHYVLDDIQWARTAAWPDAALALDSGTVPNIGLLGILAFADGPGGWGALRMMPPYCQATNCGVGPVLYAASAPRLKAEPEQQFLVLSNQVDSTQVSTTFFPNTPTFINAVRQSYCDTAGTNGLRYFLPAITQSTHVIAVRENIYTGHSVNGVVMRDWLEQAMNDGDSLADAVEEGTLVADIAGVNAFPCAIP